MTLLLLLLSVFVSGCATARTVWHHYRLHEIHQPSFSDSFKQGAETLVQNTLDRHILLYHRGCVRRADKSHQLLICPTPIPVQPSQTQLPVVGNHITLVPMPMICRPSFTHNQKYVRVSDFENAGVACKVAEACIYLGGGWSFCNP